MINKLRELAANMVISDQFLDLEEESTYFAKVGELEIHRELGETILSEVLGEFQAVRESQLIKDLEHYLEGPTRDGFLSEEEQQRALSFVIRRAPQLSLNRAKHLLQSICTAKQVVTEASFREELQTYTQSKVTGKQLDEATRDEIVVWAQEKQVPEEEVDRMLEDICLELGLRQIF